jgi:hypothetical protein
MVYVENMALMELFMIMAGIPSDSRRARTTSASKGWPLKTHTKSCFSFIAVTV